VSGDLNARELGDINKILGTLDRMMNDLASGDLEGALSRSEKLFGIDTVASFSADMRITASVAVSRYEAAAASLPMPGAGENLALGRMDRVADRIAGRMDRFTPHIGNLIKTLENYFSDWFEGEISEGQEEDRGLKWASRFAKRLMEGIGGGYEGRRSAESREAPEA
jgi:hypothetical protein